MKTLREYLRTSNYKDTFNYIYKMYLKDKDYDEKMITEIDLNVSRAVEDLLALPPLAMSDHELHIVEKDGIFTAHCDLQAECQDIEGCPFNSIPSYGSSHIDLIVLNEPNLPDAQVCAIILEYLTDL
jgi:hypothetical protein